MRISEAKECIKELYQNTNCVTSLISERGVGKTSAYKQCASELGIEYIDIYAAALEGPDFMGLPVKDIENGVTKYLAPQFLPTKAAIKSGLCGEQGILVLEEINRVPSDTISVLYPLLLDKKINGHELGEGWKIGVTMNPDTMNYLVNSLDDAMLDRFISIEVNPFIDDYIEYSKANGGNEVVMDFLRTHPDMLLIKNKQVDASLVEKSPTPRGWSKVQEIMNTCTLPDKLLMELISGIVGPVGASSFYGHISTQKLNVPSADKICSDYQLERSAVVSLVEKDLLHVLSGVIEKVVAKLKMDKDMVDEIDLFLSDLPNELQVLFFKLASRESESKFEFYSNESKIFSEISDEILEVIIA